MKFYYSVKAKVAPWEKEYSLGSYNTNTLATKAADLVRWAYIDKLEGGIDVRVHEFVGDIIRCKNGTLRLNETPNGKITVINEEFTKDNVISLLNIPFPNSIVVHNDIRSNPKSISQEDYYSVIKSEYCGINKTVGYYNTNELAFKVFNFISDINKDTTCSFSIKRLEGSLVNSDSGKKWVETAEGMQEVIRKLDLREYRRLVSLYEKEPEKWILMD